MDFFPHINSLRNTLSLVLACEHTNTDAFVHTQRLIKNTEIKKNGKNKTTETEMEKIV